MCFFLGRAAIVCVNISERCICPPCLLPNIYIYKLSGLSHLCSLCHASLLYILFQHFNDTGRATDSRTPLCFRGVKGSWLHAGLSSTPACPDSNHRKDECWNRIIKFILHLLATPQHFSISLSYSLLATRLYVYIEAPSKAFRIFFLIVL